MQKYKKHNLEPSVNEGFKYYCKNCEKDFETKPKLVCEAKIEAKPKMGKHSRASGKLFEKKVMEDLEKNGWTVCRFTKNVDLETNKLINPKPRFNPFTKSIQYSQSGFPDYLAFKRATCWNCQAHGFDACSYEIIAVECKSGKESSKYLSKEEKLKCQWLLDNKVFHSIFIATKGEKRGEKIYTKFEK